MRASGVTLKFASSCKRVDNGNLKLDLSLLVAMLVVVVIEVGVVLLLEDAEVLELLELLSILLSLFVILLLSSIPNFFLLFFSGAI